VLVRALPAFKKRGTAGLSPSAQDKDSSDVDASATNDFDAHLAAAPTVDEDGDMDSANEDELLESVRGRGRRNLLPGLDELRQAEKWMRTCDQVTIEAREAELHGRPPPPSTELSSSFLALVKMGLAFDPEISVVEKTCRLCGEQRPDDKSHDDNLGALYSNHPSARAIEVRAGLFSSHALLIQAFRWDLVEIGRRALPLSASLEPRLVVGSVSLLGMSDVWLLDYLVPSLLSVFGRLCSLQITVGTWTCKAGHKVEYDGLDDGLFSLNKRDSAGREVIFTRGVCDELASFVFNARSSYTAATSHMSSTKRSSAFCRQDINKLGRMFVALLQAPSAAFRCPRCGDNPKYIFIDGQAIGFRRRAGLRVERPALYLPSFNIDVEHLSIVLTARLRRAIRKVLRGSDPLNKTELSLLRPWNAALKTIAPPRRGRQRANADLYLPAGTVFFTFFPLDASTAECSDNEDWDFGELMTSTDEEVDAAASRGDYAEGPPPPDAPSTVARGPAPDSRARGRGAAEVAPDDPDDDAEPPATTQWASRSGPCSPAFDVVPADDTKTWSAVRMFFLAMSGDPVVTIFHGHDVNAISEMATKLQSDDARDWFGSSDAADRVAFVSNFLGRLGELLSVNSVLRVAVGRLLKFAVDIEEIVDKRFEQAAATAAASGSGVNKEYCRKWKGKPTPEEYQAWARLHPDFAGKDLDVPSVSFEYSGALPRVRPPIYSLRERSRRAPRRTRSRRRLALQTPGEDDNDRCAKSFPNRSDLTAGVFNVVCPHVFTLGFRVMFTAESVGHALSVILERFPLIPSVVFYDVAGKLDRNAMRRVRTIAWDHNVKFVLDRTHSETHPCSPIFFPDEALSLTSGVATQAAEVQHSISIKFRSHLAYMTPSTFMSHRIVQLALMNLTASYKLAHPEAKGEYHDADLTTLLHTKVATRCERGPSCPCAASKAVGVPACPV